MLPVINRRRPSNSLPMRESLAVNIEEEENQPFINNNANNVIDEFINNAERERVRRRRSIPQRISPININVSPEGQIYAVLLVASCVVGSICSFWVFASIAQIIALYTEWNSECDVPLRKFMLVNLLLPIVFGGLYVTGLCIIYFLPEPHLSTANRRRYRSILKKIFSNRTELFIYTFWILQGYNYWSKSKTCHDTAPVLYYVALLSLWISTIRLLIQYVLQCCRRAINPIILDNLRRYGLLDANIGNEENLENIYRNLLGFASRRGGASDEVINGLETQIFDENRDANDIESDELQRCAICLSQFENGDELRILPCQHNFHTDCIDQWLRTNRTCPMCRVDITA